MNPVQLIRKVQNKTELTSDEINSLVKNYHLGQVPEYQMSAFLMAVYYQGLNKNEKMNLTKAYINSGVQLNWEELSDKCVDKHSTGGTGDKTSMILAPLLASVGLYVPMMAGRGLGHTGGTLDKLESLKGYNTQLSLKDFKSCVINHGASIIGQTKDLCPADKKLYALRDVTATVSSLELITASIVSKKVAEGVSSIVYDVKTGSGAFIKDFAESIKLAESLVKTSESLGLKACALITDMSEPLGRNVGNALEMKECFEILNYTEQARKDYADTIELTLRLGAFLLHTRDSKPENEHYEKLLTSLESGKVLDVAKTMFKAQGWTGAELKISEKTYDFKVLESDGFVKSIDNEKIGWACVELGGGRKFLEDTVDPEVGFYFYKKIGDVVKPNEPLVKVYYNSKDKLDASLKLLEEAFTFSQESVSPKELIQRRI